MENRDEQIVNRKYCEIVSAWCSQATHKNLTIDDDD